MQHLMVSVQELRNVQQIFDCRLKDARRRADSCYSRYEPNAGDIWTAEAQVYSEAWTFMEKLIRNASLVDDSKIDDLDDLPF